MKNLETGLAFSFPGVYISKESQGPGNFSRGTGPMRVRTEVVYMRAVAGE
jgi:hypothetical protein